MQVRDEGGREFNKWQKNQAGAKEGSEARAALESSKAARKTRDPLG